MQVRVELTRVDEADEVEVLDPSGSRITIQLFHSVTDREAIVRTPVETGVTGTCTVPDYASTLVLYRNRIEVRREPLAGRPGEVNVVRL